MYLSGMGAVPAPTDAQIQQAVNARIPKLVQALPLEEQVLIAQLFKDKGDAAKSDPRVVALVTRARNDVAAQFNISPTGDPITPPATTPEMTIMPVTPAGTAGPKLAPPMRIAVPPGKVYPQQVVAPQSRVPLRSFASRLSLKSK